MSAADLDRFVDLPAGPQQWATLVWVTVLGAAGASYLLSRLMGLRGRRTGLVAGS